MAPDDGDEEFALLAADDGGRQPAAADGGQQLAVADDGGRELAATDAGGRRLAPPRSPNVVWAATLGVLLCGDFVAAPVYQQVPNTAKEIVLINRSHFGLSRWYNYCLNIVNMLRYK